MYLHEPGLRYGDNLMEDMETTEVRFLLRLHYNMARPQLYQNNVA